MVAGKLNGGGPGGGAAPAGPGGTGDTEPAAFSGVEYIMPIAHDFLSADMESRRPVEGSSFGFSSVLPLRRVFGIAGRANGDAGEDCLAGSAAFGSPYLRGAAEKNS